MTSTCAARHVGRARPSAARQVVERRHADQAVGLAADIQRSPLLGEHTDEVLKSVLGYDDAKIASLKQAGAFSAPPKKAA